MLLFDYIVLSYGYKIDRIVKVDWCSKLTEHYLGFGGGIRRNTVALLVLAGMGFSSHYFSVCAKTLTEYEQGLQAYNSKNFAQSSKLFASTTARADARPINWLYLGHSYMGMGDRARSLSAYRTIIDKFPGTAEAALAAQCIVRLDPTQARTMPATTAPASASPAAGTATSLLNRITVVPPVQNHPPVSRSAIDAVRTAVGRLPSNIYRLLDSKGATITLAPNIMDKWPKAGDEAKPGVKDGTLGEEPGRTYGHDVHVYEREKVRGTSELKEARSSAEMVRVLYHELGHAVDDSLALPSNDPTFRAELQADINNMSSEEKEEVSYYTVPMECFSECAGSLMGGSGYDSNARYFPRAKTWVRRKLSL